MVRHVWRVLNSEPGTLCASPQNINIFGLFLAVMADPAIRVATRAQRE